MKVIIYGAGYVGCVTAACLAKMGHVVTIVDPMAGKIDAIRQGRSPVLEPQLDEMIAEAVAFGRLRGEHEAKQEVIEADVVLVCVGTPSSRNGLIDATAMHRVLNSIAEQAAKRSMPLPVVVRSTILAPLLRQILAEIQSLGLAERLEIVLNPEFLRRQRPFPTFFILPSWSSAVTTRKH